MRIPSSDLNELRGLLEQAKEILVVTHKNPTIDSLAAALSLYLTLPSVGKRVTVACPDKVTVEVSDLVGIDKVTDSLGSKNFVISLDYVEGSIEKVSYNIEGEKFNLVIEPRPGFSFSEDKVSYSKGVGNADVVITINSPTFDEFGSLSKHIEDLANRVDVVNIDIHESNTRYGKINLVYPAMSSVSEVITFLLQELKLFIDVDAATNLLRGITTATDNFSTSTVTADSFEAAATLLRLGAQKDTMSHPQPKQKRAFAPSDSGFYPSPFPPSSSRPSPSPRPNMMPRSIPPPSQTPKPSFTQDNQLSALPSNENEAPPDWLKPKIFSSGGRNQPPAGNKGRVS